jgi:hypothetical protein
VEVVPGMVVGEGRHARSGREGGHAAHGEDGLGWRKMAEKDGLGRRCGGVTDMVRMVWGWQCGGVVA